MFGEKVPDWFEDVSVDGVSKVVAYVGVGEPSKCEAGEDDESNRHVDAVDESEAEVDRVTDEHKKENRTNDCSLVSPHDVHCHLKVFKIKRLYDFVSKLL